MFLRCISKVLPRSASAAAERRCRQAVGAVFHLSDAERNALVLRGGDMPVTARYCLSRVLVVEVSASLVSPSR